MNKKIALTTFVASIAAPIASFAAETASSGLGQSAVDTFQSQASGLVTSIGVAMLGLAGVAVAFKWGKGMFFG